MKSQIAALNETADLTGGRRLMGLRALLICGILSSLLYVVATVVGAMVWEGYSSISQSVSELMAIGAPSRPVVVPLFLAYNPLVIAFGVGVWRAAGERRGLRIAAGLLIGYGAVSMVGPFVPMHLRGAEATLTDTLHITVTAILVLFIFLIIGFGANGFGKGFRLYSIGTILVLLGFGALAGSDGPRVAANLPTPWAGVTERILIFSFLLWVGVLAAGLLRAQADRLKAEAR